MIGIARVEMIKHLAGEVPNNLWRGVHRAEVAGEELEDATSTSCRAAAPFVYKGNVDALAPRSLVWSLI